MDVNERHDSTEVTCVTGCEPLAVCMICMAEFAVDTSECPKCHVPVSVVRKCPGCSRIVSGRHSKCVYCGYQFVVRLPVIIRSATQDQVAHLHGSLRAVRAAVVSIAVFTSVFTVVLYFTRKLDHHGVPRALSRIASSYAIRRAPIYAVSSLTGAPIGHVGATATVEVLDFATAGTTALWWRITSNSVGGFVRPGDFAPPKVLDAAKGYTLLRSSILAVDEPARMLMAFDAVRYYEGGFPASGHGDDLTWLVAEQARRVAAKTGDAELLSRARDAYLRLASGGEFQERARSALEQLPRPEQLRSDRKQRQTAADIEIVGGAVRGQSSANPPHKVMLLNQKELSIQLPPIVNASSGTVLRGTVVQGSNSRRDSLAVPAGSPCAVKVVEAVAPLSPNSDGALVVQLEEIEVGGRHLKVSTAPVRIPLSAAKDNQRPRTVEFMLKTPLMLPE
jgi:hypothetical protein